MARAIEVSSQVPHGWLIANSVEKGYVCACPSHANHSVFVDRTIADSCQSATRVISMGRCPHCGVELPLVTDAFCPNCRESLTGSPTAHPNLSAVEPGSQRLSLWKRIVSRFSTPPQCPIDEATRKWVNHRWMWLLAEFGIERVRQAAVVLARPEFFPDPYSGTEEDARRILDRVCSYMGIDPRSILMSLYDGRSPLADHPMFGGQWHGAAGLYYPEGGKFRIWIEAANLDDPLAMVATMAHELGHVHLLGHRRLSGEVQDHEPLTDLLTVFLGLGVVTANSVIREQSWQEGQYAGWKIGRQGYLTMPVYGYALALFARSRGEDGTGWSRELRPDVRSAFRHSMRYLPRVKIAESECDEGSSQHSSG